MLLCQSIAEQGFEPIKLLIKKAEMAEIRIEKSGLEPAEIQNLFSLHNNLIATCRPDKLSDSQRFELLKAAIDGGARWIDVEIEADKNYQLQLIQYARKKGSRVIVSYHNFESTPSNSELNEIVEQAASYQPDLIKIACMVNHPKDNARLLALYNSEHAILSLGMGALGIITRVAALKLDAPFTFVSVSGKEQTAPGQLNENQMNKILKYL